MLTPILHDLGLNDETVSMVVARNQAFSMASARTAYAGRINRSVKIAAAPKPPWAHSSTRRLGSFRGGLPAGILLSLGAALAVGGCAGMPQATRPLPPSLEAFQAPAHGRAAPAGEGSPDRFDLGFLASSPRLKVASRRLGGGLFAPWATPAPDGRHGWTLRQVRQAMLPPPAGAVGGVRRHRFADHPDNQTFRLYVAARLRLQQGLWGAAEAALRAACRRDPNSVAALRLLARTYLTEGKVALAADRLQQARRLDPWSVRTNFLRGELYCFQGQWQRGLRALLRAQTTVRTGSVHSGAAGPGPPRRRVALGERNVGGSPNSSPPAPAWQGRRAGRGSSPLAPLLEVQLARALQNTGYYRAAADEYRRFLRHLLVEPASYRSNRAIQSLARHRGVLELLAAENARLGGEPALALHDYQQAQRRGLNSPFVRCRIVEMQVILGHFSTALAGAVQLAFTSGLSPGSLQLVQWTAQAAGSRPRLEQCLRSMAATDPAARRVLAAIEQTRGQCERSFYDLSAYLRRQPSDRAALLEFMALARQTHTLGPAFRLLIYAGATGALPSGEIKKDLLVLLGPEPQRRELAVLEHENKMAAAPRRPPVASAASRAGTVPGAARRTPPIPTGVRRSDPVATATALKLRRGGTVRRPSYALRWVVWRDYLLAVAARACGDPGATLHFCRKGRQKAPAFRPIYHLYLHELLRVRDFQAALALLKSRVPSAATLPGQGATVFAASVTAAWAAPNMARPEPDTAGQAARRRLQDLILVYVAQGRLDAALRDAKLGMRRFGGDPHLAWLAVKLYAQRGQRHREGQALYRLLRRDPSFRPAWRAAVDWAVRTHRLAWLQRLRQALPAYAAARPYDRVLQAIIAARSGQLAQARAILRQAQRAYPTNRQIILIRWASEVARNHFSAARRVLRSARLANPDSWQLVQALADTWRLMKRPHAALHLLAEFAARRPRSPHRQLLYLHTLLALRRLKLARAVLIWLQNRDGAKPWILRAWGEYWAAVKQPKRVLAIYRQLVRRRFPRQADLLALSDWQLELGLTRAYVATCRRILTQSPYNAEINNNLGYWWANHDRHLAQAQAMIQRAVDSYPKESAFRDSLGWVLLQRGHPHRALKQLEVAVRLPGGENPFGLDHLGLVLDRLGQAAAAVRVWRLALAQLPAKGQLPPKDLALKKRLLSEIKRAARWHELQQLPPGPAA